MIRDGSGRRRIPCAGERIEGVRSADAPVLLRSSGRKSATLARDACVFRRDTRSPARIAACVRQASTRSPRTWRSRTHCTRVQIWLDSVSLQT